MPRTKENDLKAKAKTNAKNSPKRDEHKRKDENLPLMEQTLQEYCLMVNKQNRLIQQLETFEIRQMMGMSIANHLNSATERLNTQIKAAQRMVIQLMDCLGLASKNKNEVKDLMDKTLAFIKSKEDFDKKNDLPLRAKVNKTQQKTVKRSTNGAKTKSILKMERPRTRSSGFRKIPMVKLVKLRKMDPSEILPDQSSGKNELKQLVELVKKINPYTTLNERQFNDMVGNLTRGFRELPPMVSGKPL